ncbi:restriction endonuclease subunit S [Alcanivorax sp.]|jgi:type I restriction enzyme, S subunit|uniref:restriction endonuclease subunit S n=1 Tax=Alcanivorax sp. TaxID=1872427 RepID=UPI00262D7ADB|nr:restriction endonuclease subunit S [Alcanivorax sp.]
MTDMEMLKTGWKKWRFDQIATNVNVRIDNPSESGMEYYVGLEHLDSDSLKIRRWGSPDDVAATKLVFQKGDIIFGRRRAYQRKLGVAEFDGICSAHALVLRANPDVVLPEFLPFFMQSDLFMNRAVEISVGSLSPTINWKTLAVQKFALPPMEEQQRLLDLYRAIEKNLIALGAACEAAVTLENSKLETALDSISDERFLPVLKLVSSGPRNGLSPKVNSGKKGYPTLSIGAVRGGQITAKGNTKYAEITKEQAEKFALKKDDVLIVRGNGNKQLTGKCGIVGTVPKGCFYPDLLIRLQFDEEIIRPKFASLQWNAPRTHQRLVSRAKSTNGIWKINGKDISQHTLKVPSIEEQDTLLEEIKTIQQARSDLEERKKKVQTLKALALKKIEQGEGVCLSTKPTQ